MLPLKSFPFSTCKCVCKSQHPCSQNAFLFSLFSSLCTVNTHTPNQKRYFPSPFYIVDCGHTHIHLLFFFVGVPERCFTYQIMLKIQMGLSVTSESIHTDPPIIKWSDLIKHTLFLVAIKSAKQRIHVKTLNQVCHKNS